MKKIVVLLSITIIFLFVYSCDKDSNPVIVNGKPGDIIGHVMIENYYWDENVDNSNIKVSLNESDITTLTDYDGKWTLKNVPAGVYDIIFSKQGFDTTLIFGFPFPGNGTMYCYYQQGINATWNNGMFGSNWSIFNLRETKMNQLKIDTKYEFDSLWYDNMHSEKDTLYRIDTLFFLNGKLDEDDNFLLFISTTPDVSKDNYKLVLEIGYNKYDWYQYDISTKSFKYNLDYGYFKKYFPESNTKLYLIAYTSSLNYETDLRNNKTRWLGLGKPSEVVEFTLPKP
jgi:hypothetical protein